MGANGSVRVVIVDNRAIFRDAARHCLTARGFVRKEHLPRVDLARLWQPA